MTRKPPRVMLDVPYYFSLNCVNNKIRESDWFSVLVLSSPYRLLNLTETAPELSHFSFSIRCL